jgi:hypothetical protein
VHAADKIMLIVEYYPLTVNKKDGGIKPMHYPRWSENNMDDQYFRKFYPDSSFIERQNSVNCDKIINIVFILSSLIFLFSLACLSTIFGF